MRISYRFSLWFILLTLAVCMYAAENPVSVDNTATYLGNDQWRWTIFITAPDGVLRSVAYVQYTLHPTFADPIQRVDKLGDDASHPFGLTRTGWGVFEVPVKVVFKNGEQVNLKYMLKFRVASSDSSCRAPFEVGEHQYRRMDGESFKLPMYVYVGELHSNRSKPSRFSVFLGDQPGWRQQETLNQAQFNERIKRLPEDHRWSSTFTRVGDSLTFMYGGRSYRLEVGALRLTPANSKKATLRVCEE
jgi:transcription initiation factor IIF auxiliary subunit